MLLFTMLIPQTAEYKQTKAKEKNLNIFLSKLHFKELLILSAKKLT
jgi:hypothetical protein